MRRPGVALNPTPREVSSAINFLLSQVDWANLTDAANDAAAAAAGVPLNYLYRNGSVLMFRAA